MTASLAYPVELTHVGEQSYEVRYDAAASFFDGHYPHFPIVPGVLLVEAAWRSVARAAGDDALTLMRVDRARFVRPVLPGETVRVTVLRLERDGDCMKARTRVTVRGEDVATVTLVIAPSTRQLGVAPEWSEPVLPAADGTGGGLDLLTVLPHRFPLLCVDAVDYLDTEQIVARKAVNVNDLGLRGIPTTQGLSAALTIESWCQAAGVLAARAASRSGAPGNGAEVMLFGGISSIEVGPPVRPGQVLVHHARFSFRGAGITMLEGWSEVDGVLALRVTSVTLAVRPATELTSGDDKNEVRVT